MQHDTLLLPFIIVNYDGDLIIKRNWISLTTTSACVRAVDDLDLLGVMPTTSPLMMLSTTVQKKRNELKLIFRSFSSFHSLKKVYCSRPLVVFLFEKGFSFFFFRRFFEKEILFNPIISHHSPPSPINRICTRLGSSLWSSRTVSSVTVKSWNCCKSKRSIDWFSKTSFF